MTEARILLVDGGPQGSGGYQAQLEADGFAIYRADTLGRRGSRWKRFCPTSSCWT